MADPNPDELFGSFWIDENRSEAALTANFSAARKLTWRLTSYATSLYGRMLAG